MTRRAWVYIWGVLLAGATLSGLAIWFHPEYSAADTLTFVALTVLTILSQLLEAEAPNRQSYYPHLVFLFAGVVLLPPTLLVSLVVIPHLVEWIHKRLAKSATLRAWYLQPFNIATHLIAGLTAHWVTQHGVFAPLTTNGDMAITPTHVLVVMLGALVYLVLNHLLIGLVLVLARGIGLRESGVFEVSNLLSDLIQLCVGYVVGILWQLSPILIVPALSPLVLIYRALTIPHLKQEARTDPKTGLWNVRHFNQWLSAELERARRFRRSVAVVMADLDLLRNINNTYGHLAGDAVLVRIGQIIREQVREYDTPARFGGEEFCVGLLEAGQAEALAFAERLRQAIAGAEFEVPTSSQPIHVTMSLGVACFPSDATTFNDLIHQADLAVYQAKFRGRNCVVSATEVPHSFKLASVRVEDRPEMADAAASTARPEPIGDSHAPQPAAAAAQATAHFRRPLKPNERDAGQPGEQTDARRRFRIDPRALLPLFVGGVIAAGVIVTILGLKLDPQPDLTATALLVALAMVAERFRVNVYGANTVSVSVAIAFAAALITGVPGAAAVSAGIVLVHYLQAGPALYKTAFNWATHVLAGSAPALAIHAQPIPLQVSNLPLLGVLTVAAGLIYYGVETGLIAIAIGLSQRTNPRTIWREQFRWLITHYLVLCILGLFLAIASRELGLSELVVFILPVFMMHYAQKQYVERTEASVRELRRMNQELIRANQEVASASDAIRQLNDELFLTLAQIIDARDPYAAGHAAMVAEYAMAMATGLGVRDERLEHIRQAALLHDIGKLGIPERILYKPARLTDEEYTTIKAHVTLGAGFLETCQGLRHLAPFVRRHHEWWDGRGYPDGLKGEQIPLEARILAVCDAAEAMASDRPYHRAMSLDEIVAELRRCAGTQFDPAVVEAFVHAVGREGEHFVINSAREVARHHSAQPDGRNDNSGWLIPNWLEGNVSPTRETA